MSNVKIGVAIATCNGAKYIGQQLQSVLNQSSKVDFISVSDDASTDGTLSIVEGLLGNSGIPYSIVKNDTRIGVIQNFALAFINCNTDFIAYCDQDDVWHQEKISICRGWCSIDGVSMVFHRSLITDQNLNSIDVMHPYGFPFGVYQPPHVPTRLWGYGHQYIFSRVVRDFYLFLLKSQTAKNDLFSNMDKSIMYISGAIGSIVYVEQDLVKFRRHIDSVSNAGKAGGISLPAVVAPHELGARLSAVGSTEIFNLRCLLQNLETISGAINSDSFFVKFIHPGYLDHLKLISRLLELRLKLYEQKKMIGIQALFFLLLAGGYGSVKKNRMPFKVLLKDLLMIFLPIRKI